MIKNKKLAEWVQEVATMCRPDHVHWCDGSEGIPTDDAVNGPRRHRDVDGGSSKRPNSIYVRSHPADVARVEDRDVIFAPSGRKMQAQLIIGPILLR